MWNTTVAPELRLTPDGQADDFGLTAGFSFAYLKELFVSSMMRWIADPGAGHMDAAMRSQVVLLREQMSREPTPAPAPPEEEMDEMTMMHRRFGFSTPDLDESE